VNPTPSPTKSARDHTGAADLDVRTATVCRTAEQRQQLVVCHRNKCLTANNTNPTPFTWTKTAEQTVEKVQRGRMTLNAIIS
jgi:hypothetical protein